MDENERVTDVTKVTEIRTYANRCSKKESEEDFPRYPNYCYYWDKMGNLTLPITHIMQDICSCRGTGSAICATVRNKSSGVGWKSLSFAHAPNSSTLKAQSSGTPSPVIIFKLY